jgi:hypothetical protein
MKINPRQLRLTTQQTITIDVDLTSEPIPVRYSRADRKWTPKTVAAVAKRYRYGDGPWGRWTIDSMLFSGHNLLKDGGDGAARTDRLYGPREGTALAQAYDLVAALVPDGDPPAEYTLLPCGCNADKVADLGYHQEGCQRAV